MPSRWHCTGLLRGATVFSPLLRRGFRSKMGRGSSGFIPRLVMLGRALTGLGQFLLALGEISWSGPANSSLSVPQPTAEGNRTVLNNPTIH
jgi:hypothetical protein